MLVQADAAQILLRGMVDAQPQQLTLMAALSCWAQSIQTVTAAYAQTALRGQ